jgi:hypothetical protein
MKKTPLVRVRDDFGGKEKLVDAIIAVLERGEEDKDSVRKRLLAASNTKLMRLHGTAKAIHELGGTSKMIDALCAAKGLSKDKDFRARLALSSNGRLLDLYRIRVAKKSASPDPKGAKAKRPATKKKTKAA